MFPTRSFLQIEASIGLCSLLLSWLGRCALGKILISPQKSHSINLACLAHSTSRTRWPKIVSATIADVEMSLFGHVLDAAVLEDSKDLAVALRTLLSYLESNTKIMPIPDDRTSAIKDFNDGLESLEPLSWHNSPWLYCENYLYRLINTCFSLRRTSFWKSYDVFALQKTSALKSSKSAIIEPVQWYLAIDRKLQENKVNGGESLEALMEEMIQVSLWGNATGLLLLIHISVEELQSHQGKKSRELSKKNVVDDDTPEVWILLSSIRSGNDCREIHIVLDNAGFEFLTDLILVAYLLTVNYATKVVLHGKDIPWLVSDVTAADLESALITLEIADFSVPVTDEDFASELRGFFLMADCTTKPTHSGRRSTPTLLSLSSRQSTTSSLQELSS